MQIVWSLEDRVMPIELDVLVEIVFSGLCTVLPLQIWVEKKNSPRRENTNNPVKKIFKVHRSIKTVILCVEEQ